MNALTRTLFWFAYSRFKDGGAREHLRQATFKEVLSEWKQHKSSNGTQLAAV